MQTVFILDNTRVVHKGWALDMCCIERKNELHLYLYCLIWHAEGEVGTWVILSPSQVITSSSPLEVVSVVEWSTMNLVFGCPVIIRWIWGRAVKGLHRVEVRVESGSGGIAPVHPCVSFISFFMVVHSASCDEKSISLSKKINWTNVVLMLSQRRRLWPHIKTALFQCVVSPGLVKAHHNVFFLLCPSLQFFAHNFFYTSHHLVW